MQTKEDIKMWKRGLKGVKLIIAEKGYCWYVPCWSCPFYEDNNGHNLKCDKVGLRDFDNRKILLSSCNKYFKGDITFLDGKLVEVVDAN